MAIPRRRRRAAALAPGPAFDRRPCHRGSRLCGGPGAGRPPQHRNAPPSSFADRGTSLSGSTPACGRGDAITVHYDPMIAKLIVWDRDRAAAALRLAAALRHYDVAGVATNIGLLRGIAAHPDFLAAKLDTGFPRPSTRISSLLRRQRPLARHWRPPRPTSWRLWPGRPKRRTTGGPTFTSPVGFRRPFGGSTGRALRRRCCATPVGTSCCVSVPDRGNPSRCRSAGKRFLCGATAMRCWSRRCPAPGPARA